MGEQKKERKNNLLTVRLTGDETDALEYLTDHMGKNKSDVISRACKFLLNTDAETSSGVSGSGTDEEKKMVMRVHVRMADTDVERIRVRGSKTGDTVSQFIRQAILALASVSGKHY